MRKATTGLFLGLFAFTLSSGSLLATVLPPTGLASGSQYQLAFLTLDGISQSSSNIADYNSFVTTQAASMISLFPGVTWHAIASTASVNAKDNAPNTTLPVYNTHGEVIVPAGVGLYSISSGSPTPSLTNTIHFDQFGNDNSGVPAWTGSSSAGFKLSGHALGSGSTGMGHTGAKDYLWLQLGQFSAIGNQPLYALSTPITFVPEPSTLALAAFGFIGLAAWAWRRKR